MPWWLQPPCGFLCQLSECSGLILRMYGITTFVRAVIFPDALIDTKANCAMLQLSTRGTSAAVLASFCSLICCTSRYENQRHLLVTEKTWAGLRMQAGFKAEMNILQTGANVAVTQLKSNNCHWGPILFFFFLLLLFFLLCCTVQETGPSFKASSPLTLTQLEEERRKRVLLLHSHRKFIILLFVSELKDSRSKRLLSPVFSTPSLLTWQSSLNLSLYLLPRTNTRPPETVMPCAPCDHCVFRCIYSFNLFTL